MSRFQARWRCGYPHFEGLVLPDLSATTIRTLSSGRTPAYEVEPQTTEKIAAITAPTPWLEFISLDGTGRKPSRRMVEVFQTVGSA